MAREEDEKEAIEAEIRKMYGLDDEYDE